MRRVAHDSTAPTPAGRLEVPAVVGPTAGPDALVTREPSGGCPWPLILLEGPEKSGKTFAALALAGSPRVGPVFAFDLGEGSLDEYAPLGPFRIVEHDGSYLDLLAQLTAVLALPVDPQRPTVIVLDGISSLWAMLCEEAAESARRSPTGQRLLSQHPDAEVPISMDKWQLAKRKWRAVLDPLLSFSGIVIVTARGKEVPVAEHSPAGLTGARREWRVEGEKSLGFDCSAWVRVLGPGRAELIGARSLTVQVPAGGSVSLPQFTVERLLFEVLGLSAERCRPRQITLLRPGTDRVDLGWFGAWRRQVQAAQSIDALTGLWLELAEAGRVGKVGLSERQAAVSLLAQAKQALGSRADLAGDLPPVGVDGADRTGLDAAEPPVNARDSRAPAAPGSGAAPAGSAGSAGPSEPAATAVVDADPALRLGPVRPAPSAGNSGGRAPGRSVRRRGSAPAQVSGPRAQLLVQLRERGEPEALCQAEFGLSSAQVPLGQLRALVQQLSSR